MPDILKLYGTEGPLGFPMADAKARQLDLLLKTLPRAQEYEYRHRVKAQAPTELNPGERSDVSWISSESVDRYGEVVVSKGMNNSQFQGNPLVTLGHAYYLPPVGKSLWQKRIKDGDLVGIKAKTRYPERPEAWPEADSWPPDKVFTLVQAGLMNGKSIGFLPTKAHFAEQKEAIKNGWPEGTLIFDEWLLLEYACCFLPANQDSLVEAVSKGLELPGDLIQAMGLEGVQLRKEPTPVQQSPPGSPLFGYTALSEVERAVQEIVKGVDLAKICEEKVKEVYDRVRGRV